MNLHLTKTYAGKVVNKRLTFNPRMDESPRYVLGHLIDASTSQTTAADVNDCPCGKLHTPEAKHTSSHGAPREERTHAD